MRDASHPSVTGQNNPRSWGSIALSIVIAACGSTTVTAESIPVSSQPTVSMVTTPAPDTTTASTVPTTVGIEACANGPGTIYTVAGTGGVDMDLGDGGPALEAGLWGPYELAFGPDDNLYIIGRRSVRVIDQDGIITTVVGPPTDGGAVTPGDAGSLMFEPSGIAFDPDGLLHVAGWSGEVPKVWRIGPSNDVEVVAGGGLEPDGDGGPATQAAFDSVADIGFDNDGRLYISQYTGADEGLHRVRVVQKNGIITTFAGIGAAGFSGDDGPADEAQLHRPEGLAFDDAGNVYIADEGNGRVRIVDRSGTIRSLPDVHLAAPTGVAISQDGTVFMTEYLGERVWKADPTGAVTVFAGFGFAADPGDREEGIPATKAHLSFPSRLAIGPDGNLYIADYGNSRIRMICL